MLSVNDRDAQERCGSSEKRHEISSGEREEQAGVPGEVMLEMGVVVQQKLYSV